MPFLGNQPAEGYKTVAKQDITGTGATVYTLDYKVTTAAEVEVFVNNVRQEPEVAYTVSGNQITFTTAVESGDDCYVVFQGRAVTSNLIESQNIADGAITGAKLSDSYEPVIVRSATAPSSPSAGDLWYDSSENVFKHYDGTRWVQISNIPFSGSGGTEVESGGYKYHTFTSSGTFTADLTGEAEYLVVAGGGGSGEAGNRTSFTDPYSWAGGGGAGGLVGGTATFNSGAYSITVGSGGGINTQGGTSSIAGIASAVGGGQGGSSDSGGDNGSAGGSGGGGGGDIATTGGSGTAGQGNNGGNGQDPSPEKAGGGGGAGAAGSDGSAGAGGGIGSNAYSDWATATSTGDNGYYAGGGGGGNGTVAGSLNTGGAGGGGDGSTGMYNNTNNGQNGQTNTGGGAGNGRNGGSGIVIIRYAI